jgi:hypothetical protein
MKSLIFCTECFSIESATHNVSKTPSFIKIHPLKPEMSSILCQKTCEIDWSSFIFYSTSFSANLTRFLTQNWRYIQSPWMDFDEWWHFGNVISCTIYSKKFHYKIFRSLLLNLALKWKLAEIWESLADISCITLKSQLICWDIYYFSERLRCRLSIEP